MRRGLPLFGDDAVQFLEQVEDFDRIGPVLVEQGEQRFRPDFVGGLRFTNLGGLRMLLNDLRASRL